MSPSLVVADCPECRAVGTVILGTCEVCFAEYDWAEDEAISRGGEETRLSSQEAPFSGKAQAPRRG
jgi:hypothetical protein